MSPNDDEPTDDQVADLLVKEANDCSLKYSAIGLDAFKPTKRPANQPKPNTRFLNNIIRGTNHHNRTLQAKENAESQAKLRDLENAEEKKRIEEERKLRKTKPGPSDTRKRMLGDIAAILGGSSKRRKAEKVEKAEKSGTSISNVSGSAESVDGARSSHRQHKNRALNDDTNVKKENGRKARSGTSRHGHHREESQEDGPSSSTTPKRKHRGHSPRRGSRRHSSVAKRTEHQSSQSADSSGSDPLDEIIGPVPAKAPAVRRRGRGANAATSGIDSRFAPDYDPRNDVTPEPEDQREDSDNWGQAVEAFRDSQKWKRQQAERLRSAGFSEDQIDGWKKDDQKDEADVQWTTAGGLREWDRGKVVNKDGTVSLAKDAEW
ncbi:hypothetical protein F4781DRAFT_115934 [Annulohypoxylon bovei var. microspora]|nr:hypothetical protein F4781DRAFT_115934 [Annulohypoxylon bovei var. microspora]